MHGHAFALLPALYRTDVTPEVGRNVFPRFQPVGGLFRGGDWYCSDRFVGHDDAMLFRKRRGERGFYHRTQRRRHTALCRKPRIFIGCLALQLAPPLRDGHLRRRTAARGSPADTPLRCRKARYANDTPAGSQRNRHRLIVTFLATATLLTSATLGTATSGQVSDEKPDQVLEWNQVFIDTLIATNTANAASQRLGAIVHTAIFDAYNGIERRYTPVFVHDAAPPGASRRAAVVAAAYTALVRLFPTRESQLTKKYDASLAALSDDDEDGGQSRERGILWGSQVAEAVFAWRQSDFTLRNRRSMAAPPLASGG